MTSAPSTHPRSALRWAFTDRRTGRIVVAQRPNAPLAIWLLATITSWFLHGTAHSVVSIVGTIALVIWAADEVARGVNPWRRALGAIVLAGVLVTWFASA